MSASDRPGVIRTREFLYNSFSEAFATSSLASQTELKVTSSFLVLPSTNFPMRFHSFILRASIPRMATLSRLIDENWSFTRFQSKAL